MRTVYCHRIFNCDDLVPFISWHPEQLRSWPVPLFGPGEDVGNCESEVASITFKGTPFGTMLPSGWRPFQARYCI